MLEKIVLVMKNLFGKSKPQTLGDGLKAIKKKYGVVEEFIPQVGGRYYKCKNGRMLDITTRNFVPHTYFAGTPAQTTVKNSKLAITYGQNQIGHTIEDQIIRDYENTLYPKGGAKLVKVTKKTSVGDIIETNPTRKSTYYHRGSISV